MKKIAKIRTLLLFISVGLLVMVLGIALREEKRQIVVNQDSAPSDKTDANLELNNVSYSTLGSDNFRQWDLNARTAHVFDEGNRLVLEELEITFYQRSGKPYQLRAGHGEVDMGTRNIRISGTITAVLPDNATIETDSAFYDNTGRTITTHDPITITRGSLVMQGVGMTADLNAETVSILNNVKVTGNK